jgi:hypothetical protein
LLDEQYTQIERFEDMRASLNVDEVQRL